jgi:hypothetical protein
MFVVKPLVEGAEPKAFLSVVAAKEWAETDAYRDLEAEHCELHFVDGEVSPAEAIAAFKAGKSEKRSVIHRRISAEEIERDSKLEALAELRDLGL